MASKHANERKRALRRPKNAREPLQPIGSKARSELRAILNAPGVDGKRADAPIPTGGDLRQTLYVLLGAAGAAGWWILAAAPPGLWAGLWDRFTDWIN